MRALDIPAEFNRLAELDTAAIRDEWQRLHHVAPTSRLSRDMLIRGFYIGFRSGHSARSPNRCCDAWRLPKQQRLGHAGWRGR